MFENMLETLFFCGLMWLNWIALARVTAVTTGFGENAKRRKDVIQLWLAFSLVVARMIYTVISFSWLLFRAFQCATAIG